VNKKLDFNRLSNPKFTLITREGRNSQMQYHPLTQRNEASNSSKCEAVSSKLDDSNPESKMLVLESLKQKLLRINGPVTTSVLKAANINK
jgi:hypothetical protein